MPLKCDEEGLQLYEEVTVGNYDNVKELLETKRFSPDALDSSGVYTALHYAVFTKNIAIAQLLLNMGADINHLGKAQEKPFVHAIHKLYLPMIELFIKHGANVSEFSTLCKLPMLIIAINLAEPAIVALLLKNGADYKWSDSKGNNAWHFAQDKAKNNFFNPNSRMIKDIILDVKQKHENNIENLELIRSTLRHDKSSYFSRVPNDVIQHALGPLLQTSTFLSFEEPTPVENETYAFS